MLYLFSVKDCFQWFLCPTECLSPLDFLCPSTQTWWSLCLGGVVPSDSSTCLCRFSRIFWLVLLLTWGYSKPVLVSLSSFLCALNVTNCVSWLLFMEQRILVSWLLGHFFDTYELHNCFTRQICHYCYWHWFSISIQPSDITQRVIPLHTCQGDTSVWFLLGESCQRERDEESNDPTERSGEVVSERVEWSGAAAGDR